MRTAAAPAPAIADLIAEPSRAATLSADEREALVRQLAALMLLLTTTSTTSMALPSANGDGRLLTPAQAAQIANVPVQWVWRRARRNEAADWVTRLSKKVMRVREGPYRAWLAKQGLEVKGGAL